MKSLLVLLVLVLCINTFTFSHETKLTPIKGNKYHEIKPKLDAIEHEISESSLSLSCDVCQIGATLLEGFLQKNASTQEIIKGLAELCIISKAEQPEVCYGILNNFAPIIIDVLLQSEFTPTQLCTYFRICSKGGSSESQKENYHDLQQNSHFNPTMYTNGKTQYKSLKNQKPLMKKEIGANSTIGYFLQLTDIHFDPDYLVGSNPNCGRPLCCRDGTGDAGVMGHYLCDIPFSTVEAIFEHLATLTDQLDFIVWTGDNPPHNVWEQSQSDQELATRTLSQAIAKTFPNTLVFPAVGNHETYPSDQYVLPKSQWLLDSLYENWGSWLDQDALDSVKEKGYYTILLRQGLRIVTVNTLDNDMINFYNLLPTYLAGPNNQSDWLINTLTQAEQNNEKVLLIGHIPCTLKAASTDQWCAMYEAVVARFSDILVGQIYGHTHIDQLVVFTDPADRTKATGTNFVTPSMTTYQNHEPGYRIFEFDYSTNQITNYYQYHANMTEANLTGHINFTLTYSAKEEYGLPDLSPQSWYDLTMSFKTDISKFDSYFKNIHIGPVQSECDQDCRYNWVCEILGTTSSLYDQCKGV
ncbi:hypothetical protein CYY_009549 [Polysphondylium violaceum]|uniref:Sphingomyelin phosphodiesterase n=1 Tax=Polysphondylium violaceum TaxID=133409 RepID=A0A8J4UVV5_9MYCE|nr:hypothetical protein CYY_009549 [Polysphondylium violaceum]